MTAPYQGCPHSAQSWFAGSDRTMRCSECEEAESAWAEKLAAAEAETTAALAWFKDSEQRLKAAEAEASVNAEYGHTAALRMNRIRQVIGDTTRDGFEYSAAEIARTVLAECDMPMEPELRRLIASEERARGMEEALRNAVEMIHDASGPLEYARANDWMRGQLRSLAPPPEAEKRGEG